MINKFKKAVHEAAVIIKPKSRFEWILLLIAVPVPFGVITWIILKMTHVEIEYAKLKAMEKK